MKPIVLFREDRDTGEELQIIKNNFEVTTCRTKCKDNLVIARYSALPYYKELEEDLKYNGCKLINSFREHVWISEFHYYGDLKEYTFESWYEHDFPYAPDGPFVIKGRTNSFKQYWKELMFAPNKKRAIEIGWELRKHPLIHDQGLIYRRFVPLKTFELTANDLPITNEWRFFFYKENLLSYGYYWSNLATNPELGKITDEAINFAKDIAKIASEHVSFFVLDIAEKESGGWILVEINDAAMSGLSDNKAENVWGNLKTILDKENNH